MAHVKVSFLMKLTLKTDLDLADDLELECYQQKGLVTKYTHVKYEGPNSYISKDTANGKVFADKQKGERTGQKLYAHDLSMRVHNKGGTVTVLVNCSCPQCVLSVFEVSR